MAATRVFLSWSGAHAGIIAEKLRDLIGSVVPTASIFLSIDSIAPGARWSPAVTEALRQSSAGIAVVTPENIHAPWLLFEAGAISNQVGGGQVIPLLCGLAKGDIGSGPLNTFQAEVLNRAGVLACAKLVMLASELAWDDAKLEHQFEPWWEKDGPALLAAAATAPAVPSVRPEPVQNELLAGMLMELSARFTGLEQGQAVALRLLAEAPPPLLDPLAPSVMSDKDARVLARWIDAGNLSKHNSRLGGLYTLGNSSLLQARTSPESVVGQLFREMRRRGIALEDGPSPDEPPSAEANDLEDS